MKIGESVQAHSNRRVAIVTGAARGIGAGVARRMASDGHAVALVDIDESGCCEVADEINEAGGTATVHVANVAEEPVVAEVVADIASSLGPPTILVNNAGIIRDNLIFKMSLLEWDEVMGVHLRGSFLMTRAVQAHMVTAKWGRIVSLSSVSALGARGQVNYAAAKAGIQGFTKALAIELGPFGITANAIAPGFIDTEMTIATAARMGVAYDEFKAASAQAIPVRRVGVPSDVGYAVSFFTSEEASYISGQVIYAAGGPTN